MYTIIIGMLIAVFAICIGFLFTNELTCIMDKKKKTEVEKENIETPKEDKKIKKL